MKYVARLMGVPYSIDANGNQSPKPMQTFSSSLDIARAWAEKVVGGDVPEHAFVEIYRVIEEAVEQVRR